MPVGYSIYVETASPIHDKLDPRTKLAALGTFMQDASLKIVEVSAVKEFGNGREPPRGAIVHFHGDDPEDGPILRYTVVMRTLPRAKGGLRPGVCLANLS